MPRVCEYLYDKGANTFWFYRQTIAGGRKKRGTKGRGGGCPVAHSGNYYICDE